MIYETHPILSNEKASEVRENGREIIRQTCKYLEIWKDTTIPLDDYIELRKTKYAGKLQSIENSIKNYKNSKLSSEASEVKRIFSEIESQELQEAIR